MNEATSRRRNPETRPHGRKWTRRFVCGTLAISLVVGGWTLRATWLPGVARWLDVGEVPSHVDYVMSLPGDENYRPFLAATMIRLEIADQVLLSQTEPSPDVLDGFSLSTAELLDRIYEYCEIPASKRMVLGGMSDSTAGDIGILSAFMNTHPDATVAVVTSDYHTRRSRWTLRRLLGKSAERLAIVSAPNGEFDIGRWWHTEGGFLCVTSEYVKLAAYLFVYGNGLWWMLGAVGFGAVILIWRAKRRARTASGVQ